MQQSILLQKQLNFEQNSHYIFFRDFRISLMIDGFYEGIFPAITLNSQSIILCSYKCHILHMLFRIWGNTIWLEVEYSSSPLPDLDKIDSRSIWTIAFPLFSKRFSTLCKTPFLTCKTSVNTGWSIIIHFDSLF